MSRREIVVLVSRAIALLQIIPALMSLCFSLPQQLYLIRQAPRFQHTPPWEWEAITIELLRIVVQLAIGALFWRCEPMIERLLLPVENAPEQ